MNVAMTDVDDRVAACRAGLSRRFARNRHLSAPPRARWLAVGVLLGAIGIRGWEASGHDSAWPRASAFRHRSPAIAIIPASAYRASIAGKQRRHVACRPLTGSLYGSGGVSYLTGDLRRVQSAVDHHQQCFLYYLNPVKVTVHDLPRYGYSRGKLTVVAPPPPHIAPTAHPGEDGLPETDVVITYHGRRSWIVLNQFERHGPRGIWAIITITPF